MRVVLLGPPGAGKRTEAEIIADHLDVLAISTGDIFRAQRQRRHRPRRPGKGLHGRRRSGAG